MLDFKEHFDQFACAEKYSLKDEDTGHREILAKGFIEGIRYALQANAEERKKLFSILKYEHLLWTIA